MMSYLPVIQSALSFPPTNLESQQRYLKLCLTCIEFISPTLLSLKTGALMKLLSEHPDGLTREELLSLFYEEYSSSSFNRQYSLKICLEKIIQRARSDFQAFGLNVTYKKDKKKYFLQVVNKKNSVNSAEG